MKTRFASCAVLLGFLFASPAWAGPREAVMEAFQKAFSAQGYRASMTSKVNGREYPTQIEVQWPNRYHITTPDSEIIVVPEGTWVKAGGQWMKMPMDMSKTIEGYSRRAMDEGLAGMGEVSEIGGDTVDGCAATVYRYVSSAKFMGVDSSAEVDVAICNSSGLPVRMVSRPKGKGEPVTMHYDFTAPVDIRAP